MVQTGSGIECKHRTSAEHSVWSFLTQIHIAPIQTNRDLILKNFILIHSNFQRIEKKEELDQQQQHMKSQNLYLLFFFVRKCRSVANVGSYNNYHVAVI